MSNALFHLSELAVLQSSFFAGLSKALFSVIGGLFILLLIILWIWASRYVKVGPNQVLVVSGRRHRVRTPDGKMIQRGFRVVKGGGVFVWPIIEKVDVMSLEIMTIDVRTPEVYTKLGVPILVDGIAQIKIKSDDISVGTAAEQFLSKGINEIQRIAQQTLEGHMRAIMGTLSVEDVYSNRDAFAQKVAEVAATDMNHMGLGIISFTIRDVRDNVGYLDSLGKARTAQVKRDAQVGEAEATRDANIAIAEAQRDATIRSAIAQQEGETAKLAAQTKVAEATRDYEINVAQFTQATNLKKAEADLAYDLQKNTSMQKVREQEVQIEIVEKTKRIEVQNLEIERKQKELESTVYKPAEAEKYRIQQLADAEQYKLTQVAKGAADAEKARGFAAADVVKAQGDAEGSAIKAKGLSQAEVIQEQGLAEARAMEQKAEAWKKYNEAAIISLFVEKFPEIASAISAPLSKVDKIVMISNGDGGSGASRITKDVTDIVAQLPVVLEAVTGIDMKELVKRLPEIGKALPQKD
ncbi:MAG: flotillin family protein [bacterium]|jgi:flotillin